MKVIAISGKKQSGKDTFASLTGFKRIAFADNLKKKVSDDFGIPISLLHNNKNEQFNDTHTYRDLLIHIGCVYRHIDSSYWITPVIDTICSDPQDYVITDVRFKNEMFELKKRIPDIITVRIERSSCDYECTDPSECELDDYCFDYIIYNNSSLETLKLSLMFL